MNWFELLLSSIGGGAVVGAVGLRFLGKIVSTRVTEAIKTEYAGQLEDLKHELALLRDRTIRFHAEQFKSYGDLWAALYDLGHAADKLWERANAGSFEHFGSKLLEAERTIGRKRLLLEPNHADDLDQLVKVMWNLRVGKERLIDLRRRGERVTEFEIQEAIEHNRQWVDNYRALIREIETDFRRQLRGGPNDDGRD